MAYYRLLSRILCAVHSALFDYVLLCVYTVYMLIQTF